MDNNEMKIAIILVNYNGYKDTIECIESIKKIDYSNYTIIVVDNKSTDDSLDRLREYNLTTKFELIEAGDNNGFSAGNNIGIKYALSNDYDAVLLLNNDTIVSCDFLSNLVDAYKVVPTDAVLTGTIYYAKEPSKIWCAGGSFNHKTAKIKHNHIDEVVDVEKLSISQITFASGCEMLIPRCVLEKVGLMDEKYFLYAEDVDYSLRIQASGFSLYYIPKSKIFHKVSSSTSKISKATQYYSVRNRRLLIFSNLQKKYILSALLFTDAQTMVRLLDGRLTLSAVLLGISDYYRGKLGKTDRTFSKL